MSITVKIQKYFLSPSLRVPFCHFGLFPSNCRTSPPSRNQRVKIWHIKSLRSLLHGQLALILIPQCPHHTLYFQYHCFGYLWMQQTTQRHYLLLSSKVPWVSRAQCNGFPWGSLLWDCSHMVVVAKDSYKFNLAEHPRWLFG